MPKPKLSHQQVLDAVTPVIGRRPQRAELVPTIEDNLVYSLDGTCFAKFGPRARTLKEVFAYRDAERAGVAVPKVLGSGDISDAAFFVIEAARGARVSSLPMDVRDRALRGLGAALRALHGVSAKGWGGPDVGLARDGIWVGPGDVFRPVDAAEWGLRYFEERDLLSGDEVEAVRACLASVPDIPCAKSSLLHSDVTSECAYADPHTGALTALIDFGDARCGPFVWEFTTFAIRDVSALETVATGYGIVLDEHRAALAASTLVRLLGGASWLHSAGLNGWRERLSIVRGVARAPQRFELLSRGGAAVPE